MIYIDGKQINTKFLSGKQRNLIPKSPGIYFLFKDENLFYVGSSSNLYKRIYDQNLALESDRIAYIKQLTNNKEQRLCAEDFCILKLRPSANDRVNACKSIDEALTWSHYIQYCEMRFFEIIEV